MINENRVNITAHAGCMNTKMDSIESVKAGIEYGADIIEIELNIKDETLILSHDVPKAHIEYEKFERVLDIMKIYKNIQLNIDVKDVLALGTLKDMIMKYEFMNRIIITGLTYQDILDNKRYIEEFKYLVNLDYNDLKKIFKSEKDHASELKKLYDTRAIGVNLNYKDISSDIADEFRKRDFQVHVWTVDKAEDMKEILKYDINSITTNKIDLLKKCMDSGLMNK